MQDASAEWEPLITTVYDCIILHANSIASMSFLLLFWGKKNEGQSWTQCARTSRRPGIAEVASMGWSQVHTLHTLHFIAVPELNGIQYASRFASTCQKLTDRCRYLIAFAYHDVADNALAYVQLLRGCLSQRPLTKELARPRCHADTSGVSKRTLKSVSTLQSWKK